MPTASKSDRLANALRGLTTAAAAFLSVWVWRVNDAAQATLLEIRTTSTRLEAVQSDVSEIKAEMTGDQAAQQQLKSDVEVLKVRVSNLEANDG